MRNSYLNTLCTLAENDKNVVVLLSDNGIIVYDDFIEKFSEQYFNFGISESNMIAVAAGMASCGKVPFAYTISSFLAYRAFEFIRDDVCLQNQNVKIVGIGSGMAYSTLGPTHHTTEDIGCLRSLPNLTIFSPASPLDVKKVVMEAYKIKGPVYIRLGTNREREIYNQDYEFETGKAVVLQEGTDLTIVSTGSIVADVLEAANKLKKESISVRVINIHTIKPFDKEAIIKAINETKAILTIEEHNIVGGLGSAVAEVIAESGKGIAFERIGLKDKFAKGYGTYVQMKDINNIGIEDIYKNALELIKRR